MSNNSKIRVGNVSPLAMRLTWFHTGAGELPTEVDMLPRRYASAFALQAAEYLTVLPCVCCCPLATGVQKQRLHCSSSRSTHHEPTIAVVFVLVCFSSLQTFVCLCIIKYLISNASKYVVLFGSLCIVSRRN